MTSLKIADNIYSERYSDFVLNLYGLNRQNFQSEESFNKALTQASLSDNSFGWHFADTDDYKYNAIDYLPQEAREAFSKAINETYEGEEGAKFRSYGLYGFAQVFLFSVLSFDFKVANPSTNPNFYQEVTLRKSFEFMKEASQIHIKNEQDKKDYALFVEAGEKFMNYLGANADKAILRQNDTSTLYPPSNSAINFSMQISIKTSYSLIYSQKFQESTAKRDDVLLNLLNSKDLSLDEGGVKA